MVGSSFAIEFVDGNGCNYEIQDIIDIPFESNLDIEITGFCPECQETSNGGFAYNFLSINGLETAESTYSLDIFYTDGNVTECLSDIDGDGVINCNDDDMDGDGVTDANEDTDLDGYYDNNNYCTEPFIDLNGDGWCNYNEITCSDAICIYSCNATDPDSWGFGGNTFDSDIDGDGVFDLDNDGITDDLDLDIDGDGIPNNIDIDIDGDGVYETVLNDNGTPNDLSDDFEEFECISNCNYIANSDIDNDIFPLGDICSSNCNNDDLDIDNDGIFNEIDLDIDGVLIDCNNITNSDYTNINTNDELSDEYFYIDSDFKLNIQDPNFLPNLQQD